VTAITPVTIPQAVNTETVLLNPGNPNLTAPPVFPQLAILTASSLAATDQADPGYSFQLRSTGGKPGTDTWSLIEGALPSGMSLSSSGLITGQTTALGPNSVTIQVADSAVPPNTATKTFSIPINLAFQKNVQGIINDGVVGQSYFAFPFTTTGGTSPSTWAAANLPPGLSINPSTGQISGIPTVANPAGSNAQITATDSAFPPGMLAAQIAIRVGAVIVIAPPTLPSGTIGVPYSAQLGATGGIGSYVFGPPTVTGGGTVDSSGLITFSNPQSSSVTFDVTVHDQANTNQFASASYTILFAPASFSNVTFVSQATNYTGGQTSPNSPIHVHVADNTNSSIANASVTVSLNGPPPCSTAVLSGTLTESTGPTGDAFFLDLSLDRGQIGYTLRATVAGLSAVSNPFNVNGFCSSASLSIGRELHTAILLSNGKVLIAGGLDLNGVALKTAQLYEPSTGTVSPTGNLSAPNGRGGPG